MSRTAARKIANAMRHAADRAHERHGMGRHRATVVSADPLLLDVHGADLDLDAHDVTFSREVSAGDPLTAGDVVLLLEVTQDEWVIVAVENPDA